jgi:Uncharacterised nucleotidyltransferase
MQPSRESIELALSQATERFAAELTEPQLHAPAWSDFEWRMARAAAVLHGVTPLLANHLRWSGPDSWQWFLVQQHQQTLLRHRRIAAVLQDIAVRAAAQGLACVALKGAALHALGVYAPGERPMADIDLLVRPDDAGRAADLLACVGYVQIAQTWKHQVFEPIPSAWADNPGDAPAALPLGEHEAYPVKVELHTRLVEHLAVSEPEITAQVFPADARPGLNPYDSTSTLLLHLLLHAAGNLCNRGFRLIHLHDIALLGATMTAQQWEPFLSLGPPKALWWAFPPLEMVNRYHPGLVPQAVLNTFRLACPWALRRLCHHANLSQLSYSSLSIPAFPAIAWCRSPRERLRYVRQRLLPGAEQLAGRNVTACEKWAVQDPWSRLSQGRRMVRWLLARPPRQAGMYIVEAALQNPHA